MRAAWLAVALAGCLEPVDPRWSLDHDHVVAVRAMPPGLAPGERAVLDALVAHAGGPVTVDAPLSVSTPTAPASLQGSVTRQDAAWIVTAPAPDALASSRPAMGLPPDAPVPLELLLVFPGERYVAKTVWLGVAADNPPEPAITFDGAPAGDTLVLPLGRDVYVELATSLRVNWLTSCGTLFQDDVARAFLRADEPCRGELALVVRDHAGGVAWRVWPIATP